MTAAAPESVAPPGGAAVTPPAAQTHDHPDRGCAVRTTLVVDPPANLGSVVERGGRALLLLHVAGSARSDLVLMSSDGIQSTVELRLPLDIPLAIHPVAWADDAGTLSLALLNTAGTLVIVRVQGGKASTPRVVARDVDRRFAPALAQLHGALLIAFTRTVDSAMHTFVARVTDPRIDVFDVTPVSHGATAATFVLGVSSPTLVMLDARAGVSPLLEVGFARDGSPLPAIVRTPVSQPYAPPLLAAVALPGGDTQVAFTAIGRAAATAVGLVPLRQAAPPRALLPSLGYGVLSLAAAVSSRAAVFALEAPIAATPDAKHTLLVKRVDAGGEGPVLTLAAEGRSLRHPHLALGRRPGEVFLLYAAGPRQTLSVLDCDL